MEGHRGLNFIVAFLVLFVSIPVQAATFDYSRYEALLTHYTKPGVSIDGVRVTAVDYAALAKEKEKKGSDYNTLLKDLASFNPETLENPEDKKAFWINVYNITAVKTITDYYPVDSIRSRKIKVTGLPWDRKAISVGGKEYSLGQIENDILLDTTKDLKIHFAINCASVSCVNLRQEPYRGTTLSKQLEEQAREFLGDQQKGLRIDRKKKIIYLSQIFKFDKKDFDKLGGGAVHFILPFLRPEDQELVKKEKFAVEYLNYDWKLNDIKNAR
jgi:uncharacterized protein DUF547